MACIDTTWNITSGQGKLMTFGYIVMRKKGHQGSKYAKRFIPLIFAHVFNENEETAILLLETLRHAVHQLFGIKVDMVGGLVSDHADAFVNAYKKVWPSGPRGQCFPHVVMKVNDQPGKRKSNQCAGYLKHVMTDRKHLLHPIKTDILRAGRCKTRALQNLYNSLSARQWATKYGEPKIAQVFLDSYNKTDEHASYRYNQFGIPGNTPQINSQERWHQLAKGSRFVEGLIDTGKSLHEMLHTQFPKLVWEVSSKVEYLTIDYRIRNRKDCSADRDLMDSVQKINDRTDVFRVGDNIFFNEIGYLGRQLNEDVIRDSFMARQANYSNTIDPKLRHSIFESADSVCMVSQGRYPDGEIDWICECEKFFKTTACAHTYYVKYGRVAFADPQPKRKVKSKFGAKDPGHRR